MQAVAEVPAAIQLQVEPVAMLPTLEPRLMEQEEPVDQEQLLVKEAALIKEVVVVVAEAYTATLL